MIAERDNKIFEMMGVFNGKTFADVLGKTIWVNHKDRARQAQNRVRKLKDMHNLVRLVPTGLMKPQKAIFLTTQGKEYVEQEFGILVGDTHLSMVTIRHNMLEMIVWYWLNELGKQVERTTVKKWVTDEKHAHAPDLYYEDKGKKVYVEIETSKKSPDRYNEIFAKIRKDEADVVLYFFEDEKSMKSIGRVIPIWDKIYYCDIESFIKNAQDGKIGFVKQSQFLASLKE